jgi:hypothetical protein
MVPRHQQAFSEGGAEGAPVRRWKDMPLAMPQDAKEPVGEYSRKVPQLMRTWADVRGRGRTVTCTDRRRWTCCRQMACKRSGVRISLAPLVRSIIRTVRTVSTAAKYSNGGPVGRRTCVRIGIFRWWGCWQDRGFSRRSGAFRRPTWANSPSPECVTPAAVSSPGSCERSAGL